MAEFMEPTLITGLFSKNGNEIPGKVLHEAHTSLKVNSWYKSRLLFLSGDRSSTLALQQMGVPVYRVFDDAPGFIQQAPVFRMKHWMVFQMLKEHKEILWIDWDTISLKPLDDAFFEYCRQKNTPKFVFIPGYHATVNCSVYYVNQTWLSRMEKSFYLPTKYPNDELMWANILPKDITKRDEYWWGERVVNIWLESECCWVKPKTYFAHIKTFDYIKHLTIPEDLEI